MSEVAMILSLLAVVFILILVWSLYLRFSYEGRLMAKLPGPKCWPIIGNSHTINKSMDELFLCLRSFHRTYGNIYKIEGAGKRSVQIINPDDVEILLSTTQFIEKGFPYNFLKPWLRSSFFVSTRDQWCQRRRMLTPAFNFNILTKFTKMFNKETEELLAILQDEVDKKETNVYTIMSNVTLNIICETSMGISLRETKVTKRSKYFEALHAVSNSIVHRIASVWLHSDLIYNFTKFSVIRDIAIKELYDFGKNIIEMRKAYLTDKIFPKFSIGNEVYDKKKNLTLLDLLLHHEKEGKIDLEEICDEVNGFVFAGHDTVAMALTFMTVRIANEPKVQNSIHQEMLEIFGESQRSPTMADLTSMKYLECCVKETLRLYPSVPFIGRLAQEDVTLSGYKVPAGTYCHIHIYDIHRHPDYFPDPEKFIPERFLPENSIGRHPYSYIPFSSGPKGCIGQKYAMLEMKTVMSGIIRRFKIEPVTKIKDLKFKVDVTLRTTEPVYVHFQTRQQV